jgi:hypothetical protein
MRSIMRSKLFMWQGNALNTVMPGKDGGWIAN